MRLYPTGLCDVPSNVLLSRASDPDASVCLVLISPIGLNISVKFILSLACPADILPSITQDKRGVPAGGRQNQHGPLERGERALGTSS